MLLCICVSVCISVSVFLCMCVYKHPHKYAQVNKTEGRDGKRKGTDSGLVSWEAQGHLGLAPMDTGDFSLVHGGWETLSPVHACRFEPCTYVWVPKQIVILKGATAHTVGDSVPCANTDSVSHSQGIFAELLVKWPGTHSFVVLWTHESCSDGPLIYKRQREPRELMLTHGSLREHWATNPSLAMVGSSVRAWHFGCFDLAFWEKNMLCWFLREFYDSHQL